MNHLDLFSGIGGFALAARWVGIETSQFVEINPYCQRVLQKNFGVIPIHDDITTFIADWGEYDLITGGFPCQDLSSANPNGKGLEGKRSGLFYELMRIVCECRPRYIVLENVSALLTGRGGRDMGAVLWELSQCGYDAEWQTISAASVGAPHLRKRVFIIAYPSKQRLERGECASMQRETIGTITRSSINSHSDSSDRGWGQSISGQQREALSNIRGCISRDQLWGKTQPPVLRVDDGGSHRVDRIRGLGNAVVPQCAVIALQRVLEIERMNNG